MKKLLSVTMLIFMLVNSFAVSSFAQDSITISFDGAYSQNTLPGTRLLINTSRDVDSMGDVKCYLNGEEVIMNVTDEGFWIESVSGKNEIQLKVFDSSDPENPAIVSNILSKEFTAFEKVRVFAADDFNYDGDKVYDTTQFFNVSLASGEFENDNNTLKITATERRTIGLPGEGDKWTFGNELSKGGCMYLSYDFKTDMAAKKRLLYVDTKKGNVDSYINGPFLETDGTLSGLPGEYAKLRSVRIGENEWHNIKIVVDVKELCYDVYIDDIQVITDGVMDANSGVPGYVYIAQNWDRVESEYYFDNVELSHMAKSYTIKGYTESEGETKEGLSSFPLSGGCAKFVFSEPIPAFTKENVSFRVGGADADFEFRFDTDENAAYITPLMEFSGREECEISFSNMKSDIGASCFGDRSFIFNVSAPIYGIASSDITAYADTRTLLAEVTINNATTQDKQAAVIICLYKASKLIKAYSKSVSPLAQSGAECIIEGELPQDYDGEGVEFITYLMDKETFFAVDMY